VVAKRTGPSGPHARQLLSSLPRYVLEVSIRRCEPARWMRTSCSAPSTG